MIIFLIKSVICSIVLLLFYRLVLEKESFFKFNRFFLLSAVIFSLVVPLIPIPVNTHFSAKHFITTETLQSSPLSVYDMTYLDTELESSSVASIPSQNENHINWYLLIYIAIVGILLVRFILQLYNFRKLIIGNPVINHEKHNIVLLPFETVPFTFLDYIFIPAVKYNSCNIEIEILEHEMVHINQKHSIDILLIESVRIIFWVNPVFYFFKKAIQLNHEFLADDKVVSKSENIEKYQQLLIANTARINTSFQLSSALGYSITKKRLMMMYKTTPKLKSTILQLALIPLLILLTGLLGSRASQDIESSFDNLFNGESDAVSQYEFYLEEALDARNGTVVLLEKLDIEGIKSVYDKLNPTERESVSYFPFLSDDTVESLKLLQGLNDPYRVEFQLSSPPVKKHITNTIWSAWLELSDLALWIDDEEIPFENLKNYAPTDFALYEVREIKGKDADSKSSYKVMLTTHDKYHQQYVMARKIVKNISANYLKERNIVIPVSSIITPRGIVDVFKDFIPENLHYLMIEELINPSSKDKQKRIAHLDKDQGFTVMINEKDKKSEILFVLTNK